MVKPIDSKLRLRLAIIAALPEPILLDRLRRLAEADLIVFRRRYGIRECHCKGRCSIQQLGELCAARVQVAIEAHSSRLARRKLRDLRSDPTSMRQTRCQCAAARQTMPLIPFAAHQLLAKLLKAAEGERKPQRPLRGPNRRRRMRDCAA